MGTPALVAEDETMVWCPVTQGRDLADRSPAGDSTPSQRRRPTPSRSGSPKSSPKGANKLPLWEDEDPDPLRFITKLPVWDEHLRHLVLNFGDRTVQSSPMNFMLIDPEIEVDDEPCRERESRYDKGGDASKNMVMLHAKLSQNTYCLDFKNPLNTVQAFGIALTGLLWD